MSEFGVSPNLIGAGMEQYLQAMPEAQREEQLEAAGKQAEERMNSVGKEFEAVFLSMMLKEMRNTLEDGGFFGGESSDTYGGMFDLFIGKHLSDSSPLGVGELVVRDYQKNQSGSLSKEITEPETLDGNTVKASSSVSIVT